VLFPFRRASQVPHTRLTVSIAIEYTHSGAPRQVTQQGRDDRAVRSILGDSRSAVVLSAWEVAACIIQQNSAVLNC